jgi:NADH-quinone oxidoreductase subunit K
MFCVRDGAACLSSPRFFIGEASSDRPWSDNERGTPQKRKSRKMSSITQVPISYYVLLSAVLFAIGVMGVLFRRNAIIVLMCIELMLNSVNLLLVAFSSYLSDANGQVFVFFIMAVAAAEVAVGLAILTMIYKNTKSTNIDFLNKLKW